MTKKLKQHEEEDYHIKKISFKRTGAFFLGILLLYFAWQNLKLILTVFRIPLEDLTWTHFTYVWTVLGEYLLVGGAAISLVYAIKGKLKAYGEEGLIEGLIIGLGIALTIGIIGFVYGLSYSLNVALIVALIVGLIGPSIGLVVIGFGLIGEFIEE